MSQDIDKLLKLSKSINNLVDIGEIIFKDGKIGLDDIGQLQPLSKEVMSIIEVVKNFKEVIAESKDLDGVEAIAIVQALLGK